MRTTCVGKSDIESYERGMKLAGGYLAFVAALLVAAVAKSNDYRLAWVVISLLALSLPSLVALILIDFVVPVRQVRPINAMRGLAVGLGFSPSLAAIAVLVGHFSVIAAALFVLLTLYWSLTIFAVAIGGTSDAKSESDIQRDH